MGIFLTFSLGFVLGCLFYFLIKSDEKYEMGNVVFKSESYSFLDNGYIQKNFYLHCVLKKSRETKNYKLEVSEDAYNYYKEGDNFPIKN